MDSSLRDIAERFGGDLHGGYALLPGPGHSPRDRSLKVWRADGRILVHSFSGDDWRQCRAHLGLDDGRQWTPPPPRPPDAPAAPTARVKAILRASARPEDVPDAVAYLRSRRLWPRPAGCTLRAHAAAEYWEPGPRLVGRFPALVARVVDADGELVTAHVTYLKDGAKAPVDAPRKVLSKATGRRGVCVRLMPADGAVIIAEGIETALAASRILGLPAWAALNAPWMAAWEPASGINRVVIAADRDKAGAEAAKKLRARLHGRIAVEIAMPYRDDFAEDLPL